MVDHNFPRLKRYFRRYNDAPYQMVVEIDHDKDAGLYDFALGPWIQYYYVASPTAEIPMPIIRRIQEKQFNDHDQIVQKIRESYLKQGRTVNHAATTRTGFAFTIMSERTGKNTPLSDYVYRSIEESLADVFGSMP